MDFGCCVAWPARGRTPDVQATPWWQLTGLTDDNASQHAPEWMTAANAVAVLVSTVRGYSATLPLLQTAEQLATSIGDPYHLAIAQWLSGFTVELCVAVRDLARRQGDRYVEALATISLAQVNVDADPASAVAQLDSAEFLAATSESSYLRDFANRTRAVAALGTGDLTGCIELARDLTASRSMLMVESAVRILSSAALLATDEAQLTFAVEIAERRLRKTPGTAATADLAAHRLQLINRGPPGIDPDLRPDNDSLSTPSLYLAAREAIDAGERDLATGTASAQARPTPYGQAVLAAIEAAATDDEDRWHHALRLAADHGLRPITVDALEGLAVAAAASESWAECLRLNAAGGRLRDETGYRWRFGFEQTALEGATAAAHDRLGAEIARIAEAEGRDLAWRDASLYAERSRGERKRPRHGWASLTATELQVVALVAEGLTNPQIGERLLMGRATVKTHLEHVFAKLGVTSRAELAAQAARRDA